MMSSDDVTTNQSNFGQGENVATGTRHAEERQSLGKELLVEVGRRHDQRHYWG